MRAWRLTRHPHADLSGEGARLYGGRWNSPGAAVVYASERLSLAILETLVHTDPDLIPDDYIEVELEVPDAVSREELRPDQLAADWRTNEDWTRARGDTWIRSEASAVLIVPSILAPRERNLLINPGHPDAAAVQRVAVRRFRFDERLFSRPRAGS
ncbi:MAG: RES family NAD+ phosphorylase [Gemmatimonadales bacterium]